MAHPTDHRALLVLEDGTTLRGTAFGAGGETFGEMVFNTGMTGYQETLTDPSYHRQVVVMTAPHVGNTGVNDEDPESARIWVAGYVVRDPARVPSSWRSRRSLDDELKAQGVVGISGIDTRALTRHLRERGAMRVGISSTETDPVVLLEQGHPRSPACEKGGGGQAGDPSADDDDASGHRPARACSSTASPTTSSFVGVERRSRRSMRSSGVHRPRSSSSRW